MPEQARRNVLVVYYAITWPLRATIDEHLYSFRRFSTDRVFYLNLAARRMPDYLKRVSFDLVLFHTIFLSRWNREAFGELMDQVAPLKSSGAVLAALPQDEFLSTDLLVEFIHRLGISHVFPVAPPETWPQIYAGVDFKKVRFQRVLTGYLDPNVVASVRDPAQELARPIDIGYRAFDAPAWLGRFGRIKADLATAFCEAAPRHGITVDISTRTADTLLGPAWYQFLLRCKYTIGVEGGAGLLDRDGSIKRRTEDFLVQHPAASFREIEQACFPGQDGTLDLTALSPRHLEACATRTCQILVEGEYNGILQPGRHYLALRRDFGNLDEVLALVRRDEVRREIVDAAYREVVSSQQCGYPHFVREVLSATLAGRPATRPDPEIDALYERATRDDRRSWRKVRVISTVSRRIPPSVRRSSRIMTVLRRLLDATR
jgi:hypothetical protein